ncbi:MAG: methionyl-tRNA formyltransferase, partial [Smithellaceae bacterium]|nr:methionyl-tRNA formyltransferase [Smithellaceae bacterium]
KGRGKKLVASHVKLFASTVGLPVVQPERVREQDFLSYLAGLAPEMIVVAAFGQILPKEIITMPPLGCINVHPSLLPKYRGAAPINWAVINGEAVTGVTIMRMDEGVDSGDIIIQEETTIGPEETYGELHDRLALSGAKLLLKAIIGTTDGSIRPIPQEHGLATHAPRLRKEDGHINWHCSADGVARLIRGLSPLPGAYTFMEGVTLKIFQGRVLDLQVKETPGTLVLQEEGLTVATAKGYLLLTDLQLESRKRMSGEEFLRGFRLRPGVVLQ